MLAQKIWQLLDIVVQQSQLRQVFQIEKQGGGHFLDLVLPEIDSVNVLIRITAELSHARHLVHVQVDLPQIGQEAEDVGNLRQLVPVQVDVVQSWPVYVLPLQAFGVKECHEVVL